jgi:SAM-dependent methyltransferase
MLRGVAVILALSLAAAGERQQPKRAPDIHFAPTAPEVVMGMLKLARVTASDVVYDLGSGDGRIVIAAAENYGARGVGIEIDPKLVDEATRSAERAGVAGRVTFIEGDMFEADISEATVVTLYLLEQINERLRPKLTKELRPGSRIVSHVFRMGDWRPDEQTVVAGRNLLLWRVPVPPVPPVR